MAEISIDRVNTSLAQLTWLLQTLNLHEMPVHIDSAICELTKLAEIVKEKNPNQLVLTNCKSLIINNNAQ